MVSKRIRKNLKWGKIPPYQEKFLFPNKIRKIRYNTKLIQQLTTQIKKITFINILKKQ
jgi:hypothetical protein